MWNMLNAAHYSISIALSNIFSAYHFTLTHYVMPIFLIRATSFKI